MHTLYRIKEWELFFSISELYFFNMPQNSVVVAEQAPIFSEKLAIQFPELCLNISPAVILNKLSLYVCFNEWDLILVEQNEFFYLI